VGICPGRRSFIPDRFDNHQLPVDPGSGCESGHKFEIRVKKLNAAGYGHHFSKSGIFIGSSPY
jgi:hypothetical protein